MKKNRDDSVIPITAAAGKARGIQTFRIGGTPGFPGLSRSEPWFTVPGGPFSFIPGRAGARARLVRDAAPHAAQEPDVVPVQVHRVREQHMQPLEQPEMVPVSNLKPGCGIAPVSGSDRAGRHGRDRHGRRGAARNRA